MLVDSHCHLDFPDLANNLDSILQSMQEANVGHALCISVTLLEFPKVLAIAEAHDNIFASVGIHPDYEDEEAVCVDGLADLARHAKVVGIGETGLDYYRLTGNLEWQRERFRTHIRAAIASDKPLIVHTRNAAVDTIRIMREEKAELAGGVMHCFTESLEVAEQAMEMGFYISFSGILTFKNAAAIKEVACQIPLDRILVETDAPYLAPVPYRGKTNQPAYVKFVAEEVANLRGISYDEVEEATTRNFFRLFRHARPAA